MRYVVARSDMRPDNVVGAEAALRSGRDVSGAGADVAGGLVLLKGRS